MTFLTPYMLLKRYKRSCDFDLREEALFAELSLDFYCVRTLIIGIILISMPEGKYKCHR